jgi:H+/Cl- antiporter ClcA
MTWTAGTYTLLGIVIGAGIGFLLGQPPLAVFIGVAIGGGLDSWLNYRLEQAHDG